MFLLSNLYLNYPCNYLHIKKYCSFSEPKIVENFIVYYPHNKEEKNESADDRVLKLFREELNEDVLLVYLYRSHKIGKKTQTTNHVHLL